MRTEEVDDLDGGEVNTWDFLQYYRLSELRLSYFEQDQPGFEPEEGTE